MQPIAGGFFVMDMGSTGHTGMVNSVVYGDNGNIEGVNVTQYNYPKQGQRSDDFVAVGSDDWQKIKGFGSPNVKSIDDVYTKTTLIDKLFGAERQAKDIAITPQVFGEATNPTISEDINSLVQTAKSPSELNSLLDDAGVTKEERRQATFAYGKKQGTEAAEGGIIEEIANSIMDPYSGQTLKNLTPTMQAKVGPVLAKKKQEAVATGDILGIMRASAGGKDPTDTFRTKLSKAASSINQLENINKLAEEQGSGPILGRLKKMNPWDTEAQELQASLIALTPTVARGVYDEVGVLTDNDVALYQKTLPTLTQTGDVQKAITALTLRTIRNKIDQDIKVQAGTGVDMSGLETFYRELDDKINQMESDLGVGKKTSITTTLEFQKDWIDTLAANPSLTKEELKSLFLQKYDEDTVNKFLK
jgi:hypothetical protein